ncbi:hypothetical protein [Roseibium sp.]|uniref:hypothetical protein n=1 Tax=Roseibium sp. TaxID=1936156 RepID=UPI0039EEF198
MTAAVYSLERRWEIPAYVWPAVLGTSVAVHLAVLSYGLPNMAVPETQPEQRTETELVLETGGLEFETLPATEAAPTQSGVLPQPVKSSEVEPLQPQSAPVTTVQQSVAPESVVVPVSPTTIVQTVTPPAATLDLQANVAEPVSSVATPANSATETVVVEAVEIQADEPVIEVLEVEAQNPTDTVVSTPSQDLVAVESPVTETVVTAVEVQPPASTPLAVISNKVDAVPEDDDAIALVATPDPIQVIEAAPVTPEVSVLSDVATVVVPSVQAEPETVVARPIAPTTTTSAQNPDAISPVVADVVQSQLETTAVVRPEPIRPETKEFGESVVSVGPVEQQVAALPTVEAEHTAISPTETNPAALPSAQPDLDPAESVPPVQVASIDPLANAEAYVSNYNIGDCAHLTVMEAGADSASVTAYGSGLAPFAVFDQRFKADNGFEASIELRLVSSRQCALLDAIGLSQGIEAAGLVDLDQSVVRSGSSVTGVIQRDLPLGKIAAANEAGLGLDGKGPPEIYLIDGAGQIHDGRNFLLPASNSFTAGGWRFSVPVTLKSSEDQETALVLAIWNRPEPRQPARFGTLPAPRIAELLREPGVYSLSAFKVSR